MRPYITVIIDSFREALASWVLWILLAVMTVGLLGLSPVGLTEQRALKFRRNSVLNWPGLVQQMKEQSQADSPSPGKRIWQLSSARFKTAIDAATKNEDSPDVDRRAMSVIVDEFNQLLPKRDFYDKASWQQTTLSQEAVDLVERGVDKLSDEDLVLLNRLLLRAAYRDQIMNVAEAEVYVSYFIWSFDDPLPFSRETLRPMIEGLLTAVMNYIVGFIAIFVAILVTASMIPRTFEAGSGRSAAQQADLALDAVPVEVRRRLCLHLVERDVCDCRHLVDRRFSTGHLESPPAAMHSRVAVSVYDLLFGVGVGGRAVEERDCGGGDYDTFPPGTVRRRYDERHYRSAAA